MILLTGADGFVGSATRQVARQAGLTIRSATHTQKHGDVAVDILRPETLDRAMQGVSTVIHAAGAAHVFRATRDSEDWLRRTNVDGTREVVAAARRAGVGHVVIVSSVSASNPSDVYGQSKLDGERAAVAEAGPGMTLTILRLATLYGEGDRGNVLRLVRTLDNGRFVWIGDGSNEKSLIYRLDAAEAIVAAAQVRREGTFTVSAPPVRMREVVTAIAAALGRRVPRLKVNRAVASAAAHLFSVLTMHSNRAAAIERTIAKWCSDDVHDGSNFSSVFGVTPSVPLADGIAREVAWYRSSSVRV
ncbi:MAG TPA: NAD-dependent epimerase/dehydratase family protein [Thermoanaerobaculia bacterium]|jgi:nucleoside-diphosphate-sugar epimerase|nr:NAD-dependent epimerase/dehydratase family protein [Thermoanaerobaculia bacterium]